MESNSINYKGDKLSYILTQIDNAVLIIFIKNNKEYEVKIQNVKLGHTRMTDYYKYEDILTYAEFTELEQIINMINREISNINNLKGEC